MANLQSKVRNAFDRLVDYARTVSVQDADPQMRNNRALTEMLREFENAWGMGTEHLLNASHRQHLTDFSGLIESVCERYPQFRASVESCDA